METLQKIIEYISLCFGVISAILGFIKIKESSFSISVIIVLCLALVLFLFAWYLHRLNKPNWTILKCRKITNIKDEFGKEAQVCLIKKMQANRKEVDFSTYGDMGGSGGKNNFKNFVLNGENVLNERIETKSNGMMRIKEYHRGPIEKGQIIYSALSYLAVNCYQNIDQEDSAVRIVTAVKRITIEVHLPVNKPAKKAQVVEFKGYDDSKYVVKKYEVDIYNKGTFLEWEKKNPKVGRYFKLVWEW
ncbi:MAG: hypothetical protein V1655_04405 [bacterium]